MTRAEIRDLVIGEFSHNETPRAPQGQARLIRSPHGVGQKNFELSLPPGQPRPLQRSCSMRQCRRRSCRSSPTLSRTRLPTHTELTCACTLPAECQCPLRETSARVHREQCSHREQSPFVTPYVCSSSKKLRPQCRRPGTEGNHRASVPAPVLLPAASSRNWAEG